ncbi:MAG: VWA domain-containing protein [Alphaproteobacteria bacterium]|nr:VWA domain-containing protein [Alphaproteobacteria bacterium]
MPKPLEGFWRDARGHMTMMLALSIVPLGLAAGAAIDYIRLNEARTELQSALDGAALAAALQKDMSNAARIALGKEYFAANFHRADMEDFDPTIVITALSVQASADVAYPTSFMRLTGINNMKLEETAEVSRPGSGKAELVLVLDYSGSMNKKGKYQSMSKAATKMIDVLGDALKGGKLKVGLVPFSAMVYTSMSKNYVNQSASGSIWDGCTQDRRYPYNTNVDTPTTDPATKWGHFDASENSGAGNCNAYANKNLKIVPLTTDLAAAKSKLEDMAPLGNTNIPLGAEFGWNLLDPQAPFTEGAAYTDTETRKFLVLLTDGVQTSKEWGKSDSRSVKDGQQNLVALCGGMRAAGITVFTIAYDITDPAVTTLLSDCAPGRYYEPEAGDDEISAVFNAITSQIKNQVVRITK